MFESLCSASNPGRNECSAVGKGSSIVEKDCSAVGKDCSVLENDDSVPCDECLVVGDGYSMVGNDGSAVGGECSAVGSDFVASVGWLGLQDFYCPLSERVVGEGGLLACFDSSFYQVEEVIDSCLSTWMLIAKALNQDSDCLHVKQL